MLLTIREMQTKMIMRYHLVLVRMAIMKKMSCNKYWQKCEEIRTFLHHWWKCNWCSHYGKQYGCSSETNKQKNRATTRSSNSTPGNISKKKKKNASLKRYMQALSQVSWRRQTQLAEEFVKYLCFSIRYVCWKSSHLQMLLFVMTTSTTDEDVALRGHHTSYRVGLWAQ